LTNLLQQNAGLQKINIGHGQVELQSHSCWRATGRERAANPAPLPNAENDANSNGR